MLQPQSSPIQFFYLKVKGIDGGGNFISFDKEFHKMLPLNYRLPLP